MAQNIPDGDKEEILKHDLKGYVQNKDEKHLNLLQIITLPDKKSGIRHEGQQVTGSGHEAIGKIIYTSFFFQSKADVNKNGKVIK